MPNPLIEYLEKKVKQERWLKKPRVRGTLVHKQLSSKGNWILEVEMDNVKHRVIILKRNKNLHQQGASLAIGSSVFIMGRRYLGKLFAERIGKSRKDNSRQRTLLDYKSW